ncbi:nucleoside diphosphate kinase A-like isoform X1 [Dipodomys merriami]|uniref:nucleoside diphosphate kinase A-like isoform X1 n=1 Tax=Dipodomys merriami TaxID=94247 RepID=UPI003855C3EA
MICLVLTIFANLFPAAPGAAQERTFVAVKPDGVQRRLVGEVVRRFERKGFKLVALKLVQASEELLREHYAELRGRPFFGRLLDYMRSGPVVAMVSPGGRGAGGPGLPADPRARRCGGGPTWCAPRGRSLGPRTRRTPGPAPSAGTSAWRSARTWSTAATLRRAPAGRSRCGSARTSCCARGTAPRAGCTSSPVAGAEARTCHPGPSPPLLS